MNGKKFTVTDMQNALDRIKSSPCMSDEARMAAECAIDLLLVFRQFAFLEWNSEADLLYMQAQGIANELDGCRTKESE